MRLSQTILMRGNQRAILQGMIHVAPEQFYKKIQEDLNLAAKNGDLIFFEGVTKGSLKEPFRTPNERKIKSFLLSLFSLYPVFAKSFGWAQQKEKITYPKKAINADLNIDTVVSRLHRNGFTCNILHFLMCVASLEELASVTSLQSVAKNVVIKKKDFLKTSMVGDLFKWFFFRKAFPVILDDRNLVAVDKIHRYAETPKHKRNIFVHYGEAHMKGLVKLFQQRGWKVIETTFVDLSEFF